MKEKELYEKVMNKGGQNGDVVVADPVAKNATLPGAGQNKEGMKKIDDPSNTPVEECDSENNTKPTAASAAANKASVAMKEEADSKEFTIEVAFEGEELSEEFKEKAVTIFEAAVQAKVESITSSLEEQYQTKLEEEVAQVTAKLSEQIDSYLNYVVEKWMEENELAIESSLRTEITEEFIEGMRTLFAENYIEVPEDKLDILEDLANQVEELSNKLNESINDNIELATSVKEFAKQNILASVAEGLTVTQKDKFATLAEGVEFIDEETYAKKLQIVKENYFKDTKVASTIVESEVESAEEQPESKPRLSGPVANYVHAISRSVKK